MLCGRLQNIYYWIWADNHFFFANFAGFLDVFCHTLNESYSAGAQIVVDIENEETGEEETGPSASGSGNDDIPHPIERSELGHTPFGEGYIEYIRRKSMIETKLASLIDDPNAANDTHKRCPACAKQEGKKKGLCTAVTTILNTSLACCLE